MNDGNGLPPNDTRPAGADPGCRLPRGEVYLFDQYVVPAARGRSIAPVLTRELLRHVQQRGYRRAIAVQQPDNAPGRRTRAKGMSRPYALIAYVTLGRWRHDFWRPVKKT